MVENEVGEVSEGQEIQGFVGHDKDWGIYPERNEET